MLDICLLKYWYIINSDKISLKYICYRLSVVAGGN